MEDSKRRIQFQNWGVQKQAIWRIYQEIEKKRAGQAPLAEDSPEIPELGVLLDGVCGGDTLVAHANGEVLLTLVQNGILHPARAFNMLLAAAPSVLCVSALVRTVHQLLVMEALGTVASKTSPYTCPYGLKSKPHPLIGVLTHRPEAWHPLAQEIAVTFVHQDPQVQSLSLELVRPVVAFLLTEPQDSDIYTDARRGITRVLLSQLRPERNTSPGGDAMSGRRSMGVVALLLKLLPQSQLKTSTQLIFAVEMLEELSCAICHHHPSAAPLVDSASPSTLGESPEKGPSWPRLCAEVYSGGLELLLECSRAGVPCQSLAVELASLAVKCPSSAMSFLNINLVMLGEILDDPLAFDFPEMIYLVEKAVLACPTEVNILCMASLLKPLLQILSNPDVNIGSGRHSHVKARAGEVLLIVKQKLQVLEKPQTQFSELPKAFLGPNGLKCALVVDLCSTLIGAGSTETNPAGVGISKEETLRSSDTINTLENRLLVWSRNVTRSLERRSGDKTRVCSSRLSRLAAALLLLAPSEALMRGATALVRQIARLEPSKALDFLPVIMYAVGNQTLPECRLVLLETLPHLATHKYCVSPILKIVVALSQSPSTRALAIRLMTSLWQQQDRCFPQLLNLLNDAQEGDAASDILLAKAAAILQVCKLKPEKHGAEVLSPLSRILEMCSGPQETAASAILVESLYLLCQAEVMDLSSLWSVLGSRHRYLDCRASNQDHFFCCCFCVGLVEENESRPLVAARVCRLLSLAPGLAVDTPEFQAFSTDVIRLLWQFTQNSSPCVRQAAFQALSRFPADQTRVSYLPHQVTAELHREAELATEHEKILNVESGAPSETNEANHSVITTTSVDQLYPDVPASCYTALLRTQLCRDEETLQGFERFLQAAVAREVQALPRGVYFASTRRQAATAGDGPARAAVDKIPVFLQQQFERCKQPTLRSALAAGLLFCYDPPVEKSRDGRQFVVRHSKMFMQMFTSLLQEVRVLPSDWHVCSQLPSAWSEFMQRLFTAVREGRRAQLDFQAKQGNLAEAEANQELSFAWMWSRDTILSAIQAASTGSHHAQANSALSLAGLALCMHNYVAQLEPAASDTIGGSAKFMGHNRWLTMACDTVLSLVNVEYKPLAGLFGLCRQISTLDRVPASPACRAISRAALSQLVPVLMTNPSDIAGADTLQKALACLARPEDLPPELALWNGLALGLYLGRLFEEHFSHKTGSKGMVAVWKALSSLETACLAQEAIGTSDAVPSLNVLRRTGNILGLTSALCGLCKDGGKDVLTLALTTLKKIENCLQETPEESNNFEVMWYCVAMVCATAQTSHANAEDTISPLLDRLVDLHQSHSQKVGISLSLGLIASTMSKLGYKHVDKITESVLNTWLKNITLESPSTECKLSSLCGLVAALGSQKTCARGSSTKTVGALQVSEVLKAICNLVSVGNDQELQISGALMLGHLHLSLCSVPGSQSLAPPTYDYLSDTSFLRAAVDFLLEAGAAGTKDPETDIQIAAVLQSFTQAERPLPPVDWAGLLSPLMRVGHGDEIRALCLQVAASQMSESSSAALFVSSWLTPPLFYSLTISSQAALHQCLPQVIKSVSPAVLKIYLERSCSPAFEDLNICFTQAITASFGNSKEEQKSVSTVLTSTSSGQIDVVMSVLTGLRAALAVTDPPQSLTMLLYEALGRFYQLVPLGAAQSLASLYVAVLQALAECLALVPDDVVDSILASDFSDATTQLKGSFIRCHLVASGLQPIPFFNIMIDASFNVPSWNHDLAIGLLTTCLAEAPYNNAAGQASCVQWLLELLGHTSSIVSGAWPLADSALARDEVIHRLISVVASVFLVLVSLDSEDLAICGLDNKMFMRTNKRQQKGSVLCEDIKAQEESNIVKPQFYMQLKDITNHLPLSLLPLASKKWEQVLTKVIDWLLTIGKADDIGSNDKSNLHGALIHLRHTQQFTQASVWTKAILF